MAVRAGAHLALFAFVGILCARLLLGDAILGALKRVLLCWLELEVVDSCWLRLGGPNGENRLMEKMLEALAVSLGLAGVGVRFQGYVEVDERTFRLSSDAGERHVLLTLGLGLSQYVVAVQMDMRKRLFAMADLEEAARQAVGSASLAAGWFEDTTTEAPGL